MDKEGRDQDFNPESDSDSLWDAALSTHITENLNSPVHQKYIYQHERVVL